MIIKIDSNEYSLHPLIVKAMEKSLNRREKKNKKIYDNNVVIPTKMECGDYMYNNILVEHMTLSDFCGKVMNGNIFRQAQDMLYTKQQNPETKLYILISGDISNIFSLHTKPNPFSMIAAWASLNRIGIPTSFMGNQWFFIEGMLDLFEKHYDGKIREYNPVRKPVKLQDQIITNYCSIPGISEQRARLLQSKYPTPYQLYNAKKDDILTIDGIGEKTAQTIIDFIHGKNKGV